MSRRVGTIVVLILLTACRGGSERRVSPDDRDLEQFVAAFNAGEIRAATAHFDVVDLSARELDCLATRLRGLHGAVGPLQISRMQGVMPYLDVSIRVVDWTGAPPAGHAVLTYRARFAGVTGVVVAEYALDGNHRRRIIAFHMGVPVTRPDIAKRVAEAASC